MPLVGTFAVYYGEWLWAVVTAFIFLTDLIIDKYSQI